MSASIHRDMPSLNGKRVFITGGTTGLGRAIGNLLASNGARIFTCGRHGPELAANSTTPSADLTPHVD